MHLHHTPSCFKFCISEYMSLWKEPNDIRKRQKLNNNTTQGKTTGLDTKTMIEDANREECIEFQPSYAWEDTENESTSDEEESEVGSLHESDEEQSDDNQEQQDNHHHHHTNLHPNNQNLFDNDNNYLIDNEILANIEYSAFNLARFDTNAIQKIVNQLQIILQTSLTLQSSFAYLKSDQFQVKLLYLLDQANVPHYLFEDIQNWAQAAYQDGYRFDSTRLTRSSEIAYLKRWLNLDSIIPQTVECVLPGPLYQVVPVTRFDFSAQLISLLTNDSLVSNLENLDVNTNDPFGPYLSSDGKLSCFNSGQWYKDSYDKCINDPNRELFLPICFACDETKLQANGKTGCCPVMFTTTLFSQQLRNTPVVWRPLGYVYDLSIIESSVERDKQSNDLKYSRYHSIFSKILETYILAQKGYTLNQIKLTLGNVTKVVDIKVPCAFIIGDMQGGDKLCCSSPCYSNSLNRICRKCNVSGAEVGNPDVVCKNIRMDKVKEMVKHNQIEALNKLNQYNVFSAWFDVDFGGCKFGVFSAAMPIEPLHSLENGLISDCLNILFTVQLKKNQLNTLDKLAKQLVKLDRQYYISSGSQKDMPTLLWKSGISSLTCLKAHEKVGIMLTIVVISLTTEGKAFFDSVLNDKDDQRLKMQEVFQMMMCYWSWLKKEKFWKRGDIRSKERYKDSIKKMLTLLSRLWPREKGQGWAKAKYHEQLHVPDDIERNGAPMNTHTGPTEHNHIEFVKNPARRTQRRQEDLDKQLANRFVESCVIKSAFFALEQNENGHSATFPLNNEAITKTSWRAGYVMLFKDENNHITYYIESKNDDVRSIDPTVFNVFAEKIEDVANLNWVQYNERQSMVRFNLFFEYKRGGVIFRSHNNYRSKGQWHDWVMVRWGSSNPGRDQPDLRYTPAVRYKDTRSGRKFCYTPGKIVGLFFQETTDLQTTEDNVYTVIWPCTYDFKKSSVFTLRWMMSFKDRAQNVASFEVISCGSIVRHACMIPEALEMNNQSVYYHEVWPKELWAEEF